MALRHDIGIDLGTASVLVYIKNRGIVLQEPSVVAIETNSNKLLAVGEAARGMIGRAPGTISVIRPLRDGVISDYQITERMLKYFINRALGTGMFRLLKPRVVICVPSGVTGVERKAVIDASTQAGAKKTYLIEEPIAAALGVGIDITQPTGNMVIDIGGGTTDIAVISLGSTVVSTSIKTAGDKFDEAIIKYLRRKYNLMIGDRSAENLKMNIGSAYERVQEVTMDIRGRNQVTGLPITVTVSSYEMMEALSEPLSNIIEAIRTVLERTPPELASDIAEQSIILTGGGSLIYGLDKLIEQRTGIRVTVSDKAISCVALGTGEAFNMIETIEQRMREAESSLD